MLGANMRTAAMFVPLLLIDPLLGGAARGGEGKRKDKDGKT